MSRMLDTIKAEAPDVYWRAVDMANERDRYGRRVHSSLDIASYIRREVVTINGARAVSGNRREINLSLAG